MFTKPQAVSCAAPASRLAARRGTLAAPGRGEPAITDAPALAPAPPTTAAVATVHRRRAQGRSIRLLVIYAVLLALIAFWPTPVDRGASGLLEAITHAVPWLTYDVIETSANVVLFVPFGLLLALALPLHRGVVIPIALATTLVIESGQALLLAERTPSLRDIVANVLGAAIGLAIVHLRERRTSSD
ncbi:VanZ family protein [Microbacterium sp. NPDC056569]|uniref:VanZ family protein n=1 Tax=Microbacterium sp. NPDC056569 TaxID=3345867 RepID=UPI003670976D